ncbi:hypothetical protein TcCL_NonESM05250 [Trypanosoma cruzi]|nr:hypothetical protein TcCL_NonESM05250 [Trypanosoma cruzi]
MNGCRQEALTIHMAREHAATPRRNAGEKGEKAGSSANTQKKQTTGGKSTVTVLALAGNSTPALTQTHTHHRSAASPRVRGFGPPQKEGTHRQQSHTNGQGEEVIPHPSMTRQQHFQPFHPQWNLMPDSKRS